MSYENPHESFDPGRYAFFQKNAINSLEHLESKVERSDIVAEIAKGWAILTLAEATLGVRKNET